ncbi:MAG: hypothetical protein ACE5PO_03615 [Candidatus Bathyarchaeia archaeon]
MLKEKTELDTLISMLKDWCKEDPSGEAPLTLWNVAGSHFFLSGDYACVEALYQAFYKWLLDLQKDRAERYSKSVPLYHLGLRYWASEYYPEAIGFFTLGYIEEVLDGVDFKTSPSRNALAGPFLISASVLDDLAAYVTSPKAPSDKTIPENLFQAYLKEKPRLSSSFCRAPWDKKKTKCPRCGEKLREGVLTPRLKTEESRESSQLAGGEQTEAWVADLISVSQVVFVEKTPDNLKALEGSPEEAAKLPGQRLMALTCPLCLRVEMYLAPPKLLFKKA